MLTAGKHLRGSIVLYGVTTGVSGPLDAGLRIEIKIEVEAGQNWQGELYFRVPMHPAPGYEVGEVYSIVLTPVT